ncbi:hypothetical protein GCM10029964_090640 [Kibdelosporangium lantanae]
MHRGRSDIVVALASSAIEHQQWPIAIRSIIGLVKGGALDEAEAMVDLLPASAVIRLDPILLAIVSAFTERSEFDHATQLITKIADVECRDKARATIGTAAAEHDDWRLAERMATGIEHAPQLTMTVLTAAASAATRTGHSADVRRILAQLPDGWPRAKAELQVLSLASDISVDERIEHAFTAAQRENVSVHELGGLIRTAIDKGAATLVTEMFRALTDRLHAENSMTLRALNACYASDIAHTVGRPEVAADLLTIAEEAAFAALPERHRYRSVAMEAVIRTAGEHGDDERFDRLILTLTTELMKGDAPGQPTLPDAPTVTARLAVHAGRFADADAIISRAEPWDRHPALLAAVQSALSVKHLDTAQVKQWVSRWLVAAIRLGLDPELAWLIVQVDPTVAPLISTWFHPVPLRHGP